MDIEEKLLKNNCSNKTIEHTFDMFEFYGFDHFFGRSNAMKITHLKSSASSKIIAVVDPGKGKYQFNIDLFYQPHKV